MTLFADLVDASSEIAGTSARSGKIGIPAALLKRLEADEVPIAVALAAPLSGDADPGILAVSNQSDAGPLTRDGSRCRQVGPVPRGRRRR